MQRLGSKADTPTLTHIPVSEAWALAAHRRSLQTPPGSVVRPLTRGTNHGGGAVEMDAIMLLGIMPGWLARSIQSNGPKEQSLTVHSV